MNRIEICPNINICLEQLVLSDQPDVAVATSHLHVYSVVQTSKIFCFDYPENLFSYLLTIQIRKDLPLIMSINSEIDKIVEAGFVSKWINNYKMKKSIDESSLESFSLRELFGLFIIPVLLLLMSIVLAVVEQIIYKNANTPNTHWFWKLASDIIDGKRHLFILNGFEWRNW